MARQEQSEIFVVKFLQKVYFLINSFIIVFYPVGTIRTTGNVRPKIPGFLNISYLQEGKR